MDRILKFAVVGGWGFVVNTTVLVFGVRWGLRPSIAAPIGAELAIISNFILNNLWTFADKTLTLSAIPEKFLQFNVLSLGSTIIQFTFLRIGEAVLGLTRFKQPFVAYPFFSHLPLLPWLAKLPILEKIAPKFSFYLVIYCFAVGVGMVVNYVIYSQIIWR
ncbi:GtrA family protein [Candidatus Microgenomates bacterium]|nr:GtrA family protein [Candidatus Microgenomates bacterium]